MTEIVFKTSLIISIILQFASLVRRILLYLNLTPYEVDKTIRYKQEFGDYDVIVSV